MYVNVDLFKCMYLGCGSLLRSQRIKYSVSSLKSVFELSPYVELTTLDSLLLLAPISEKSIFSKRLKACEPAATAKRCTKNRIDPTTMIKSE